MATYVFGDIHGEHEQLVELLNKIEYDRTSDQLIFLGDYIDRGQNSLKTYELIWRLADENKRNVFLRGNHEQMMIDSVLNGESDSLWTYNGGSTTLDDFHYDRKMLEDAAKWFNSLPIVHSTDDYIFVHAGIKPGLRLHEQSPSDMLWIRQEFIYTDAEDFKDDRVIIAGHTPFEEVMFFGKMILLDTGAGKGGHLSCLDLSKGKVISTSSSEKAV